MPESKFDRLKNQIKREYEKKGYSSEEAEKIAEATAAKIGFEKYGKSGMEHKSEEGRS